MVSAGVVSMTSSGAKAPSRELKFAPSEEAVASSKLYVPTPVTTGVTSYSTHWPGTTTPASASTPLSREGRFCQVIARSLQSSPAAYSDGPSTLGEVAYSRTFALVTTPERPLTLKRR